MSVSGVVVPPFLFDIEVNCLLTLTDKFTVYTSSHTPFGFLYPLVYRGLTRTNCIAIHTIHVHVLGTMHAQL